MDLRMYSTSVLKDALLFIGNDRNVVIATLRTAIQKEILRRQELGIREY
ncbi:hypothetical protein [Bacillus wiedmannii]|nr:hypothetical protein [Bacillus wiedmannii]